MNRGRALFFAAALWAASPASVAFAALEVPPPKIAAGAFILMDFETGQVIAEQDADTRLPPASLAKIMTGFVIFRALDEGRLQRDREIEISTRAWKTGGSRMFIEPQTPVAVGDLLRGLVVQSGNDSAVALAGGVCGRRGIVRAGDESTIARVGAGKHAMGIVFGLAAQIAMGFGARYRDFDARDDCPLSGRLRALCRKRVHLQRNHAKNRNRLLDTYPGADGIKTGYTKAAGYSLAASATRDGGRRLVAVVMKTKSAKARAQSCARLLDYGFSHFETAVFFDEGKTRSLSIWGGDADSVPVRVLADSGKMVLPRGTKWKTEVEIESPIVGADRKRRRGRSLARARRGGRGFGGISAGRRQNRRRERLGQAIGRQTQSRISGA